MKFILFFILLILTFSCAVSENDPCSFADCSSFPNTHCEYISNETICVCDSNYMKEGDSCILDENSNPCKNFDCSSLTNSECKVNGNEAECVCKQNYVKKGNECKLPSGTDCSNFDCSHKINTHCEMYGKPICICNDGFSMKNGECRNDDPCSSNPCTENNKTICSKIDRDNYECYCNDGYKLEGASCVKTDDYSNLYSSLGNSKDKELIDKLHNLVKNHNSLSYNGAKSQIKKIDSINGKIECVYSGIKHSSSSWDHSINCEHVWPQSYFGEASPMKSDLHHLFPVTSNINSKRGNVHFGEVTTVCPPVSNMSCNSDNDCKYSSYKCNSDNLCEKIHWARDWDGIYNGQDTGCKKGVTGTNCNSPSVFEVRDEVKGDVARALFYFAVRYKDKNINQSQAGGTGPNNHIPPYEEIYLRKWHHQDPVDARERNRNNKIDEIQGNRNPFIDRPDLVERIGDF